MGEDPVLTGHHQAFVGRDPGRLSLSDVDINATMVAGILDAAPDGLVMIDDGGHIVLVNARIEELFGYDRGDLLGHPVEMLLPENARAAHVAHRQDFAESPRVRPMGVGMALSGRRADGTEFPVAISLSPLATGRRSWAIAAVRDDTERAAAGDAQRATALLGEQDRIARHLADTVIRELFGTGLQLQGLLEVAGERARPGITSAIDTLDATIREIRRLVFGAGDTGL